VNIGGAGDCPLRELSWPAALSGAGPRPAVECPRFGGHLSAWSALSGWAGRMRRYAKGIELSQAVLAGVPA
jgi:hypothetical protein